MEHPDGMLQKAVIPRLLELYWDTRRLLNLKILTTLDYTIAASISSSAVEDFWMNWNKF